MRSVDGVNTKISGDCYDVGMDEWYEKGLRFTCTQCGNCCTGPPGAVWFTKTEGKAMAKQLEISVESFYLQYARKLGNKWSLTERVVQGKYDCVFLDRSTEKPSCSLYEGRPMQCRTWPFWPEILQSKASWERTKQQTPCPGMGNGNLVPIESIRIQRDSKS